MKQIELTQGQVAIVDDADYEWLSQWKWCAQWSEDAKSFYAVRSAPAPERGTILMHRQIAGLTRGDKKQADHRNHATLDNQRKNIRSGTCQQNHHNLRRHRDNKSGYKGVSFSRGNSKWAAFIKAQGKNMYLGYFLNPVDAAKAYDKAAIRYFGEFAMVNFPEEAR